MKSSTVDYTLIDMHVEAITPHFLVAFSHWDSSSRPNVDAGVRWGQLVQLRISLPCQYLCLANQNLDKKIWLRPGKKYLFGRTKQPTGGRDAGFRVDHKSISRQHLTIIVANVQSGNGTAVNTRSEITLKDEDTKFKTEIDGVKIKNESKVLRKAEHVFRLGNLEHAFRIKWQPVVFTFSLSSKEMKKGNDPLNGYRIRLEELDVKVTIDYMIGQTTHVVAGKRNTAKGLQALINAKYIVSETFIDALVYATTPSNLDEAESLSPLEEDFESNWPDERQHLPAKSKEPSERPAEDFVPNVERGNIFEGYTFVFCDSTQFDALHKPIANGGGKALEFKLRPGMTSAHEIVRFIKNAAGEKGLGEFEDGSEGKGVVVVKFRCSKGFEDWAADLDREVAQALDLRLIEQSEFLDAILANDASILRRPLLPAEADSAVASAAVLHAPANEVDEALEPKPSLTPVKRRPRGKIVSRFKGFDDDEEETFMPSYVQRAHAPAQPADSLPINSKSQRYEPPFADGDEMVVDSQAAANGCEAEINTRKRPAPPSDNDDDEDLVDKLLPAATAMKRRRLEDEENGVAVDESLQGMSQAQQKAAKSLIAKPLRKEINFKDVVRERREAMEAAVRVDEQSLRETLNGMTVEEMKNLAVVEDMEIPRRHKSAGRTNGEDNARWDERWNGRKNFKKFRRRGDSTQARRRGPSVIVPLEEAKRKDFGIGEVYWQGENMKDKSQRSKEKLSQSQSQSQLQSQAQRNTPYSTTHSQPHTAAGPAELVAGTGDSSEQDVIDVDAPRTMRSSERTTQLSTRTSKHSLKTFGSQTASVGKRPASGGQMVPPMVKKRKKFAAAKDSDSDD